MRGGRVVELDRGPSCLADVLITDGIITDVGEGLVAPSARVLDARGSWLIPGLWDKHVHFEQWVRSASMLDLSGATSPEDVCVTVSRAAAAAPPGEPLFGFGHRLVGWHRQGTVAELDAAAPGRAVVLISGDAHNGWLNTDGLILAGLPPRDGMIAEQEWFDALARLGATPPSRDAQGAALAAMTARGLVGLVDMEFEGAWRRWPERPSPPLRVRAAVYPHELDEVIARGLRTGDPLAHRVTMGPLKIISDGSLGTGSAWCHDPYQGLALDTSPCGAPNVSAEALVTLLRRAKASGLEVALHAIGDRAVTTALDSFEATGAAGSVEHAQLLRRGDLPRFASLGVTASIQPHHLISDRDAASVAWADRTDRLFLARSLLDAGATLALGSDAPVSPLNPWLTIASAVHRSGDERPGWYPHQSLTPRQALAACVDGRRLLPGQPGDLVVLDANPLRTNADSALIAHRLRHMPVRATVCAGEITHGL